MKVKKSIIYLITLLLITGIIIGIAYSKYILKDQLDISISGAKYYMTVSANKETITPSSSSITLTLNNFDGDNVSNTDIKYVLSIDNNKFEINDTTTKILEADGSDPVSDDVTVTFTPKGGAVLNDTESITLTINVTSPYVDSKQIEITFKNLKIMALSVGNDPLKITEGTDGYDEIIKNNLIAKDEGGNDLEVIKTYTISPTFDVDVIGTYTVTYTAQNSAYEDATLTASIKVEESGDIPLLANQELSFNDFNFNLISTSPYSYYSDIDENGKYTAGVDYITEQTAINRNENGILTLSSTEGTDPKITMPLKAEEYFSPQEYRYVKIRYRMNSANVSQQIGFYIGGYVGAEYKDFSEDTHIYADVTSRSTADQWQEATLDLWQTGKIVRNMTQITKLRFDWTNKNYSTIGAGNMHMEIDYIKFLKDNTGPNFVWLTDFTESTDYSYYNTNYGYELDSTTRETLGAYSFTGTELLLKPANSDPWIKLPFINRTTGKKFALDPKNYRFVYVQFYTDAKDSAIDLMQVYAIDESGSISEDTSAVGAFLGTNGATVDVVLDLAKFKSGETTNAYDLSKYIGIRLDPVGAGYTNHVGKNIHITSISVSDRCQITPINDTAFNPIG